MAGVWLSVALWLWMDDAPLIRHLLESGSDFALKKTSATSWELYERAQILKRRC